MGGSEAFGAPVTVCCVAADSSARLISSAAAIRARGDASAAPPSRSARTPAVAQSKLKSQKDPGGPDP